MGMLLYGRNGISVRPSLGSFVTWRSLGSSIGVTFIFLAVWYPVWHALPVDVVVSQIELSAFHHGQFVDVQQLHLGQLREHAYARGRLTEEASSLRGHNRTLQERLEGAEALFAGCAALRSSLSGRDRGPSPSTRSVGALRFGSCCGRRADSCSLVD